MEETVELTVTEVVALTVTLLDVVALTLTLPVEETVPLLEVVALTLPVLETVTLPANKDIQINQFKGVSYIEANLSDK